MLRSHGLTGPVYGSVSFLRMTQTEDFAKKGGQERGKRYGTTKKATDGGRSKKVDVNLKREKKREISCNWGEEEENERRLSRKLVGWRVRVKDTLRKKGGPQRPRTRTKQRKGKK